MSPLRADSSARIRLLAGAGAILLLVIMAIAIPHWGGLRLKAMVDADQTFRLTALSEGSHQWSLRNGWPAEGEALVREQVLEFERSDLVELAINPELSPGDEVEEGQIVAWLRSPRDVRRGVEIEALQEQLAAAR